MSIDRTGRFLSLTTLALAVLAALLLPLAGCSDDDDNPTGPGTPTELPAELVGDWAISAATVNGTVVSLAEFLEWNATVTGDMLSLANDGSYTEREFAADRSVVETYTGTVTVDGDHMTVTENTGKAAGEVVFDGTWSLLNNRLTLTQTVDGDEVVMIFHRLVTIDIAFTVTYLDDSDSLLGGAISEGMTGSGFYTYDAAVEDNNTLDAVGDYWSSISPCGIFLELGGLSFQTDLADVDFLVEIVNNHNYRDNYLLRSYNNLPLSAAVLVDHISWQLDDPSAAANDDATLPLTPPVLEDWQQSFALTITGSDIANELNTFMIRCQVASATLAE